ncbi:hypothetical protein BESB_026090 [Besnoitia besnoiti]|uniref:Sec16 Sec23-binding domain-containing protein n=1 Tax=Besnoitia besnoiti TaxID=94643 RepID=A0A2A9M0X8_BESBE|nr:uncharacterized protein BESB_026090 [Besnoitia besnoiti]PFH31635.1 hypothetical protein BESB_026090 [Besnoitia besnoiti]
MSVSNLFASDPSGADDDWLLSAPRTDVSSSSPSTSFPPAASSPYPGPFPGAPGSQSASVPPALASAVPPVPSFPFRVANPFALAASSPAQVASSAGGDAASSPRPGTSAGRVSWSSCAGSAGLSPQMTEVPDPAAPADCGVSGDAAGLPREPQPGAGNSAHLQGSSGGAPPTPQDAPSAQSGCVQSPSGGTAPGAAQDGVLATTKSSSLGADGGRADAPNEVSVAHPGGVAGSTPYNDPSQGLAFTGKTPFSAPPPGAGEGDGSLEPSEPSLSRSSSSGHVPSTAGGEGAPTKGARDPALVSPLRNPFSASLNATGSQPGAQGGTSVDPPDSAAAAASPFEPFPVFRNPFSSRAASLHPDSSRACYAQSVSPPSSSSSLAPADYSAACPPVPDLALAPVNAPLPSAYSLAAASGEPSRPAPLVARELPWSTTSRGVSLSSEDREGSASPGDGGRNESAAGGVAAEDATEETLGVAGEGEEVANAAETPAAVAHPTRDSLASPEANYVLKRGVDAAGREAVPGESDLAQPRCAEVAAPAERASGELEEKAYGRVSAEKGSHDGGEAQSSSAGEPHGQTPAEDSRRPGERETLSSFSSSSATPCSLFTPAPEDVPLCGDATGDRAPVPTGEEVVASLGSASSVPENATLNAPSFPSERALTAHLATAESYPDCRQQPCPSQRDAMFALSDAAPSFCRSETDAVMEFARASAAAAPEDEGSFAAASPSFLVDAREAEKAAAGDPLFLFRDDDASDSVFSLAAVSEFLGPVSAPPAGRTAREPGLEPEQSGASRESPDERAGLGAEATPPPSIQGFTSSTLPEGGLGEKSFLRVTDGEGVRVVAPETRDDVPRGEELRAANGATEAANASAEEGDCSSSCDAAGDSVFPVGPRTEEGAGGTGAPLESATPWSGVAPVQSGTGEGRRGAADAGALQSPLPPAAEMDFSSLLRNPLSSASPSPPTSAFPLAAPAPAKVSPVAEATGPKTVISTPLGGQPEVPVVRRAPEGEQAAAPSFPPRSDIPIPPSLPVAPPAWLRIPSAFGSKKEPLRPDLAETAGPSVPAAPPAVQQIAPPAAAAPAVLERPSPSPQRPASGSPAKLAEAAVQQGQSVAAGSLPVCPPAPAHAAPAPGDPSMCRVEADAATAQAEGVPPRAQHPVGARGAPVALGWGGFMLLGTPENSRLSELPLADALARSRTPPPGARGPAAGGQRASLFMETVAAFPGPLGAPHRKTTAALARYFERVVDAMMRQASADGEEGMRPAGGAAPACRTHVGASPAREGAAAGARLEVCGLWAFLLLSLQQEEQRSPSGGAAKASPGRLVLPPVSSLFPLPEMSASIQAAEDRLALAAPSRAAEKAEERPARDAAIDLICRRVCRGDVRGAFDAALREKMCDHALALGNVLSSDAVNEALQALSIQLVSPGAEAEKQCPHASAGAGGIHSSAGETHPARGRRADQAAGSEGAAATALGPRWRRAVAALYSVVGQETKALTFDAEAVEVWYPTVALVSRFAGLVHPTAQRLLLSLSQALAEQGDASRPPCASSPPSASRYRHASQLCALLAGKTVVPSSLLPGLERQGAPDGNLLCIGGNPIEELILTETFEYLQRLYDPQFMFPQLIPAKIRYALCLADLGLLQQAHSYCSLAASFLRALPQAQVPADLRQELREAQQKVETLQQSGRFATLGAQLASTYKHAFASTPDSLEAPSQQTLTQHHPSALTPASASPQARAAARPLDSADARRDDGRKDEGGLSLASVVGGGWLGGMIGGLKKALSAEERNVGVENAYYYDHVQKRWRERGREHEEEPLPADGAATGSSDSPAGGAVSPPPPSLPPPPGGDTKPAGTRAGADKRNRYVDVFSSNSTSGAGQRKPGGTVPVPVMAPGLYGAPAAAPATPMPASSSLLKHPFGAARPQHSPDLRADASAAASLVALGDHAFPAQEPRPSPFATPFASSEGSPGFPPGLGAFAGSAASPPPTSAFPSGRSARVLAPGSNCQNVTPSSFPPSAAGAPAAPAFVSSATGPGHTGDSQPPASGVASPPPATSSPVPTSPFGSRPGSATAPPTAPPSTAPFSSPAFAAADPFAPCGSSYPPPGPLPPTAPFAAKALPPQPTGQAPAASPFPSPAPLPTAASVPQLAAHPFAPDSCAASLGGAVQYNGQPSASTGAWVPPSPASACPSPFFSPTPEAGKAATPVVGESAQAPGALWAQEGDRGHTALAGGTLAGGSGVRATPGRREIHW